MTDNYTKIANEIYSKVYVGDDKNHRNQKVQEIADWLQEGDTDGMSIDRLADEWSEYDQEE